MSATSFSGFNLNAEEFMRDVVKDYLLEHPPYKYVVDSVDDLIHVQLPRIFKDSNLELSSKPTADGTSASHKITLHNVLVKRGTFRDEEGRLQNDTVRHCIMTQRTFQCCILADVVLESVFSDRKETFTHRRLPIVNMPICVDSFNGDLDADDRHTAINGCFIVNGLPKQIGTQLQLINNTIFVFDGGKNLVLECRSLRQSTPWCSTSTLQILYRKDTQKVIGHIPFFTTQSKSHIDVPLQHILLFLNPEFSANEETLSDLCSGDNDLIQLIQTNWDPNETYKEMMEFYSTKLKKPEATVLSIFLYQFVPHVEGTNTQRHNPKKLPFLLACLKRITSVVKGERMLDSRDHIKNKQVMPAGSLLASLFRQVYRSFLQDLKKKLVAFIEATPSLSINSCLESVLRSNIFGSRILSAFSSGNLSLFSQNKRFFRAQDVYNIPTALEQYRQVSLEVHKESKAKAPRLLHASTYGYLCSTNTVDGQQTGILNCLTYTAQVSKQVDVFMVIPLILSAARTYRTTYIYSEKNHAEEEDFKVFCNGIYVISTSEGFTTYLRNMRRKQLLPESLSVCIDRVCREISIRCDVGRLIKPCFVVDTHTLQRLPAILNRYKLEKGNLFLFLCKAGIIEWLDAFESTSTEVCVAPSLHRVMQKQSYYTHAHLHSTAIFSNSTSVIPFSNHNAAARTTYWSGSQFKSLICMQTDPNEARHLSQTVNYGLTYTQKPVCTTFLEESRSIRNPELRTPGQMCGVLVAALGFNIEDCIICNKSSLERGLFQYIKTVPIKMEIELNSNTIVHCRPTDGCIQHKILDAKYNKIQSTGLPKIGTRIQKGEVIIGAVERVEQSDGRVNWQCCSVVSTCDGTVTKVLRECTKDSCIVTVVISQVKSPVQGDKLCSRHGQKGTIGIVLPQHELPFSEVTGMSPDLIFNSHGYPSRMTVGQLFESSVSKAQVQLGLSTYDATPFIKNHKNKIEELLLSCGMRKSGTERFRSGATGELIEGELFCGLVHYGLLKHFVSEKIQARGSRGRLDRQTRQPVGMSFCMSFCMYVCVCMFVPIYV